LPVWRIVKSEVPVEDATLRRSTVPVPTIENVDNGVVVPNPNLPVEVRYIDELATTVALLGRKAIPFPPRSKVVVDAMSADKTPVPPTLYHPLPTLRSPLEISNLNVGATVPTPIFPFASTERYEAPEDEAIERRFVVGDEDVPCTLSVAVGVEVPRPKYPVEVNRAFSLQIPPVEPG
jgi:hypothetical protein